MKVWRADLIACGRRARVGQAIIAWFANPGFALACHYRLAHWAVRRGRAGRCLALLSERRMIGCFACHISAQAEIGPGVNFPHPVAIVIGEGVRCGTGCVIYHGVTLGRRSGAEADYPRIGDGAVLYCGATVLGAVVLPDGSVVGAQRLLIEPSRAAGTARHSRPARAQLPA